jgi:hypothetical protein
MPNMATASPAMAAKCARDGRAASSSGSVTVTRRLGASSAARRSSLAPDRLGMVLDQLRANDVIVLTRSSSDGHDV